ncbi:MAG: amidohydrolase family protein [Planctomycetes bacterium]|nr:amidohydrolase family protein [Planctomycetota bacterium]
MSQAGGRLSRSLSMVSGVLDSGRYSRETVAMRIEPTKRRVLQGQCVWPISANQARVEGNAIIYTSYDDPFHRPESGYLGLPDVEYEPIPVEGIIMPAFCDWHFHWVQHRIAGVNTSSLLPWLQQTAWPEEARFEDAGFAQMAAQGFAKSQRAAGTLGGACWGSPHAESIRAAQRAGVAYSIIGPAIMARGEPDYLVSPLAEQIEMLRELQLEFEETLAVTPRFALSFDEDGLREMRDFAYDFTLWTQTHLAENMDEVEAVKNAFPDAKSYTDVYDRVGLLTPRTLLAHCIHLDDFDWRTIKKCGSVIVHCPTSNEALSSGRMKLEKVRAMDIPWVLGSDIGAGPDLCMLDVIDSVTRIHDWSAPVSKIEAFFRATVSLEMLESYASRKSRVTRMMGNMRPGFIEFNRPKTIGRADRDPERILSAIVESYRAEPESCINAVYDQNFNRVY